MADEIMRLKKAMGMRTTLTEIGCKTEDEIAELTKKSMSMLMKRNPIELTEKNISDMYKNLM